MTSYLDRPNDDQGDSYSPSLFELQSSSWADSGLRNLENDRRDLVLRLSVNNDREDGADADSLHEAGADFLPEIAMYRVQYAVGIGLAQMQTMLQKREAGKNSKGGNAKDTDLNNEDKIKHAEKRLRELKKNTVSGIEPVDSYNHAKTKLKKESAGFIQRLKRQKQS
jgi:hypothetical protein